MGIWVDIHRIDPSQNIKSIRWFPPSIHLGWGFWSRERKKEGNLIGKYNELGGGGRI
jgi:hypothetical protein